MTKKTKIITRIISIDERNLDLSKLHQAAEIIKNGGLVVFPTETVYGLGANALDADAVKKIYAVKGRPSDNPLIVHVAKTEDIYNYAHVPHGSAAERIIKTFMPSPLTLVLKKLNDKLNATCALDTVAIRVPQNNTARRLIELAGVPIAAPSANLSGKPSPTNAAHIVHDLSGDRGNCIVDMIICGENSDIGLESTVISFNEDDSLNILRAGFITREDLSDFVIHDKCESSTISESPASPGMKYKHYAPSSPLYILSGNDEDILNFVKTAARDNSDKSIGFLCYTEVVEHFKGVENITAIPIGAKDNLREQARNLFDVLNKFNETDVNIIYSIEPNKTNIGEALYDRLIKASGGEVIKISDSSML